MKMGLKKKLLAAVLGIIVFIMSCSTVVVAVLLQRQNKDAVYENLKANLNIIMDDLKRRQAKQHSDADMFIRTNKIGEKVKFIYDFSKRGQVEFTRNSAIECVQNLAQMLVAGNLWQAAVYDPEGRVMAFAQFVEGRQKLLVGYAYHDQGPQFTYCRMNAGDSLRDAKWQKSQQMPLEELKENYSRPLPSVSSRSFAQMGGAICLLTAEPVFANRFNKKTKKVERALFGAVTASQHLDAAFAERMREISGMDVNFFLADGKLAAGTLPEYDRLLSFQASDQDQEGVFFKDVTLSKGGFFQAALALKGEGQVAGWISVAASKARVKANTRQMMEILAGVYLLCMVIVMPLAYWLASSFVRKVNMVVSGLKDIAEGEGDLTRRLEVTSRDELGDLAHWFNVFIEKMQGIIKDVASNAAMLDGSSTNLEQFSREMAAVAEAVSEKSEAAASMSETVNLNISSIASAMEQSSVNLSTVASAAEEMTATINEIARNTETANNITGQAVEKVHTASQRVDELGDAAQDIGKVVETITEISEQVNLLALNATIEAARAGEAGKGFAVVANEIKELANQTAEATAEIKTRIEGIQQSADGTIADIETITSIINEVNEIVSTITAAIEEQSSTTREIAGNVAQASDGVQEVNEKVAESTTAVEDVVNNIGQANQAAGEMSAKGSAVRQQTKELSELAARLNQMVGHFKV